MSRIREEIRRDADKDPAELEREIDSTRAELKATLELLEERLSPSHLVDQAVSQVRRHSGELAGNLGSSIKENPMPALLASVGIAWMMASNGRHHETDGAHSAHGRRRLHEMRERLHGAKDAMRQGTEAARERLSSSGSAVAGSASAVRARASDVSSAARRQAGHARDLLQEQPLVLGVLGIAAGVIAGAMMPPTDYEDEHIGPLRDRALERAKAKSDGAGSQRPAAT